MIILTLPYINTRNVISGTHTQVSQSYIILVMSRFAGIVSQGLTAASYTDCFKVNFKSKSSPEKQNHHQKCLSQFDNRFAVEKELSSYLENLTFCTKCIGNFPL